MVKQIIEYAWNRPITENEKNRLREREQLGDWADDYGREDLSVIKKLWHESLLSLAERIKIFQDEVQGIIDEKIATNEPYDKRSYLKYLELRGLYAPDTSKQQITAEDVKSKIQMQDLVGRYVQLRKSGSNFTCICPFHDDKHPSACVYTKSNTFKCFSCGEYHDVIGFMMKIENLTFLQALNQLSNNI